MANNSLQIEYEQKFNDKINYFKDHSKYLWLRDYADGALIYHTEYGALAIKSIDFMDRIIAKPVEYIQDWLDGKNKLEW
jgi:aminoglycoside/choline kinase family phosphotransferase